MSASANFVLTMAGAIALTRICLGPSSHASSAVRRINAAFDAP
ncbi:Uncharacterised protein [Mycobacteroides abscessus subsp. abscessus]|nr:Uncharacterised protein [Mycobacteroides abscessus subsp. abscessus]